MPKVMYRGVGSGFNIQCSNFEGCYRSHMQGHKSYIIVTVNISGGPTLYYCCSLDLKAKASTHCLLPPPTADDDPDALTITLPADHTLVICLVMMILMLVLQGSVFDCSTPFDPLPRFLANSYSMNHPDVDSYGWNEFPNGTIQGAKWYPCLGTLQVRYMLIGGLGMAGLAEGGEHTSV